MQDFPGVGPHAASQAAGAAPVIITVHGTNDSDPADEGHRWWQCNSQFSQTLLSQLSEIGMAHARIQPFHWSGANSDHDRLQAASGLTRLLRQLAKSGTPHAVVAHSHGGNVAQEALARAPASPVRGGIVTFGTPFFKRKLKTVPLLIALFQVLMGAMITPIMIWYLITALSSGTDKIIEAIVLFGGLAAIALWTLQSGVRKLAHRQTAVHRLASTLSPSQWLVLYSPRDEAMRLLESAALLSPHYVKTAAAVRSLKAFASLAGVLVTVGLFTWFGRYFLEPIWTKVSAGQFGLGTAADLTFVLLIPIVYGAVYLLIAGIARFGGGWLYARMLSSAIHGGLLGAAFGGDARYRLTGVSRLPTYLAEVTEQRIDAVSFGGVDDAAVFIAAQKLYDSIVAAEGPEGGIADPDSMWKRLSDALYHNAYMRDADVIATVANHLATHGRKNP